MDPEAASSKEQKDALHNAMPENSSQYTMPHWFLENIRITEELKASEVSIWLKNSSSSDIDKSSASMEQPPEESPLNLTAGGHDQSFHVSRDTFDKLLDHVSSLQMPDRIGRFSLSKSSIVLSCCMRFGLQFLDELVVLIAQKLGSSLVSFNAQDLEDLGLDFYYQELESQGNRMDANKSDGAVNGHNSECNNIVMNDGHPSHDEYEDNYDTSIIAEEVSKCFFGTCHRQHRGTDKDKRGNDAFSALLNAVQSKSRQQEADMVPIHAPQRSPKDSVDMSSPIILYFRDGLTDYLDPSGGKRGIPQLVRQNRKVGKNIIMIFAATHTDVDESELEPHQQVPWKISKCKSHGQEPIRDDICRISVLPLDVPTTWPHKCIAEWSRSIAATRIESFKRRLNSQLYKLPSSSRELLKPHCDWLSWLPKSVTSRFASVSFKSEVKDAFNLILARSYRRGKVDICDVRAILQGMNGINVSKSSEEGETHDGESVHGIIEDPTTSISSQDDAWVNFSPEMQKMVEMIKSKQPEEWSDPFYWEKRFLSLIINPKSVETSWSDLSIDTEQAKEIQQAIDYHQNGVAPSGSYGLLRSAPSGGALVYGPPGTGKTQLARVLAHECGMVVICATPADIESKYYGEGPKSIQGLFNLGKLLAPSLIFIDEADALLPSRDTDISHKVTDLNQFLHEMDGLSASNKNPFILLATNRPGRLDPAVLRRVPHKFYFGLPNTSLRDRIFRNLLKEEVHPAVRTRLLADRTSRYTGSDIRAICVQVAILCNEFVEDGENKGKRVLTMAMFKEVLDRTSRTATKAAISSIRAFAEDSHPRGIEQMNDFEADDAELREATMDAKRSQSRETEELEQTDDESENEPSVGQVMSRQATDPQVSLTSELEQPDPESENEPSGGQVMSPEATDPQVSSTSLVPSAPCSLPQQGSGRVPLTTEISPVSTVTSAQKETTGPAHIYGLARLGSNRIRVLSIAPVEGQAVQTPISCTIDEVDLKDWTDSYRSFKDTLPEFKKDQELVKGRIQHVLWNAYCRSPDDAKSLMDDKKLRLLAKAISFDGYCDQPVEKFSGFRNRFNWGDYIALSYVWGDQNRQEEILLNGYPFKVGSNLHDALLRLRSSYEIRNQKLQVWIDAICIDQGDLEERATEVQKMGSIYSEALAVRGWLGRPSEAIAKELPVLREILKDIFSLNEEGLDDFSAKSLFYSVRRKGLEMAERKMSVVLRDEDKMFTVWSTMDSILGVPYWKRLWIIQEIALGSSLLFWYGDCYITPRELLTLSSWVEQDESIRKLTSYFGWEKLTATLWNVMHTHIMLSWLRENKYGHLVRHETDQSLIKCMAYATSSQATDPRDKVYGLLALLPPSISSRIRPNYEPGFTWRDVWTDFTEACFKDRKNLNLLPRVNRDVSPAQEGVPSWSMNFQIRDTEGLLHPGHPDSYAVDGNNPLLQSELLAINAHLYDVLSCASDKGFLPEFTFHARLLSCKGIFVDEVANLGSFRPGGHQTADAPRYMTGANPIDGYRKTCPDPKLSLARALVGDSKFQWTDGPSIFDIPWFSREELQQIPKEPKDLEMEWTNKIPWRKIISQEHVLRELFSRVLHPNELFMVRGTPLRTHFSSKQDHCDNWSRFDRVIRISTGLLFVNRIFESTNGLIGWVTKLARPGDRIAILFGCDMPVVLRPKAGKYEVIGGCFVDGLMNGEAAEKVQNGCLIPEIITLC